MNIIPLTNENGEVVEPIESIIIYEHIGEEGKKYYLSLNLMDTTPAYLKGWELVRQKGLMTVGISLGNGYFSRKRLEVILAGMAHYFSEVTVIIADLPTLHSYYALGYDEHTAMHKLEIHSHSLMHRCETIFNKILDLKATTSIITWKNVLMQETLYQKAYQRVINIYQNNAEFRQKVQENTEHHILAMLEDEDINQVGGMKMVVEKAAHYLLEEMAFHEVSHLVLGKESISSYYKPLELITNYINGQYGNPQNNHVGIVVYHIFDR